MKPVALPDPSDLSALLELLPALEDADASTALVDLVTRLVHVLYDHRFVLWEFRWMDWEEGPRFLEDPALLATADLETVCKLLTAHARSDRFVEGHLESMVVTGHLASILRRLRELQQSAVGNRG